MGMVLQEVNRPKGAGLLKRERTKLTEMKAKYSASVQELKLRETELQGVIDNTKMPNRQSLLLAAEVICSIRG